MSFAYLHILLSLWLGSHSEGQAFKIFHEHKQYIEQTTSNRQSYLSDFSDLLFDANSNESIFGITENIISSGARILFRDSLAKKNLELKIIEKVSNYLIIAEHRIIRFRSSDIIFPFNYFW
ncbi:MAG: hypothetical protein HQ521_01110 [Bacteroidetes bacterium]|nr:hypothetical protein [Bacteroidota bacterium]